MQKRDLYFSCLSEPFHHARYSIQYFSLILYLSYNVFETSYTTYINHARWHRCLRSDGLRVGGNWSARRKPTKE